MHFSSKAVARTQDFNACLGILQRETNALMGLLGTPSAIREEVPNGVIEWSDSQEDPEALDQSRLDKADPNKGLNSRQNAKYKDSSQDSVVQEEEPTPPLVHLVEYGSSDTSVSTLCSCYYPVNGRFVVSFDGQTFVSDVLIETATKLFDMEEVKYHKVKSGQCTGGGKRS